MIGRPERTEAEPYYFRYIDQVPGEDVLAVLNSQLEETPAFLSGVSEEKSLHRYGPDKWTMRQVLNHVNDCERLFGARAFWFARGFDSPLPSFDQIVCAAAAQADEVPWARHVEEFRAVRRATLSLFGNLPAEAWTRSGIASGYVFSVRALAWIAAGHTTHHIGILRDRYR
jgi:hypothetical protein